MPKKKRSTEEIIQAVKSYLSLRGYSYFERKYIPHNVQSSYLRPLVTCFEIRLIKVRRPQAVGGGARTHRI